MAQAVPNLCVSRKVFLKHKVNWNTVCGALRELPWRNIWLSDNGLEVLNEHPSLLLGRYVPSLVICCPARIAVCIRGAQGVLPCVGWGVQPVNWIYRL